MSGPDRPRGEPYDRIVYLPVKVAYEGLYDETNGPYFKGLIRMSTANGGVHTYSISESCVLTGYQVLEYESINSAMQLKVAEKADE